MQASFKIRLFIDVEEVDLFTREIEMPFVPHAGDLLGVGKGNDYHAVESTSWAQDQGITVYLRDLTGANTPAKAKRALGSKWAPFGRPSKA